MKLTFSLSYYNQGLDAFLKHLELWKNYDTNIKKEINFMIVDDGSKVPLEELIKDINFEDLNINLYRVEVDLYCNIAGVRNLSARECNTEWMLILDMDTLVPKKMAYDLINIINKKEKGKAYKFNRLVPSNNKDNKHHKIHPAVCLIRKEDYWNVGGCEEDLVGHYGGTDPTFFYKAQGKIKVEICKNIFLNHLYEGEADIIRDTSHNIKLIEEKKKNGNWSTDYVRFPWKKILSKKMEVKKLFFVHIPKNGGTTSKFIINKLKNDRIISSENRFYVLKEKDFIEFNSSPRELLLMGRSQKIEHYFTFCFTRNPWDRCVSYYFWCLEHPRRRTLSNGQILKNLSFDKFIKLIPKILKDSYKKYNNMKWHLSPQYEQTLGIENKKIDFIGKLENFEEDFKMVLKLNNINFREEDLSIKKNKTTHKHYSLYYNEETKKIVEDIYKKDIEEFGYYFENYSQDDHPS